MDPVTSLIVRNLDEAYNKRAWHGTNLRGSLRGMSGEEAAWRPARGRHNCWEIMLHCAYWKYAVRRRLTGQKRGSFPLKGSNWFARPAAKAEWASDVALLAEMHAALRDAIGAFDPALLYRSSPGSNVPPVMLMYGIAAHDVYHTGQIQIIKRLM
jgi:uncharacterized damage-inducible protein DinB